MSPRPGCCWLIRAVSCGWWPPPARPPGCSSCSSSRTTRVRAWTASGPAGLSRPRTWRPRRIAGRGSRRRPGFAAVQALPMRLREQVIGALNLFRAGPGALAPADIRVGQALADVATISLLHERGMRHSDTLNEQLQAALNSRVIIEQAKGKLAERLGVDMDQAFSLLRGRARTSNRRLSDLAQAFVDGSEALTGPAAGGSGQRRADDGQLRQPPRPGPRTRS